MGRFPFSKANYKMLKNAKKGYEDQMEDYNSQQEAFLEEKAALDAVEADATAKANKIVKEIEKMKKRLAYSASRRESALLAKNVAVAEAGDARTARVTASADQDAQAETVARYTQQASDISARVPVPQGFTYKDLETKIIDLNRELTAFESRMGGSPGRAYGPRRCRETELERCRQRVSKPSKDGGQAQ